MLDLSVSVGIRILKALKIIQADRYDLTAPALGFPIFAILHGGAG